MEICSEEALKYVWEGAIPLQIHLHESEVTTLPSPPPLMVLGPRIGYLPLLIPDIKPHFSSTLPPGSDTVWFDYKGLPLKWYIPTGVLFDLLCAEPERPWDLTVHFRGHPGESLVPYESEDNIKWSFINSLKEAAYIINGNCKSVMNMSQADQYELWQSLVKELASGNMDSYLQVSSRLKLGPVGEDLMVRVSSSGAQPRQANTENDFVGTNRSGRIPIRLYIRYIEEDLEDLEEASAINSWDKISYMNRPVEVQKDEGSLVTLKSAMESLLRGLFDDEPSIGGRELLQKAGDGEAVSKCEDPDSEGMLCMDQSELQEHYKTRVKLIRIQGIELDPEIPFHWVVNNLRNPEFFLHVCIFVGQLN
ncbi:autophagy protein 5 [Iris pallida]|uniref:Autophagy protein 5 n=1 Tax=Iris pallida TaxID=29817 RepID=A0AAX6DN52_IRIPA|nr:autophagy protein 5 [Iris pallida]